MSKAEQQQIPGAFDKVIMPPDKVLQARRALGLRQRELAALLQVHPATVCRWERRTGVGGPVRVMLRMLEKYPWTIRLLGLNYPGRVPTEAGDEGAGL